MSSERSSSAVRNLRSIFENKASDAAAAAAANTSAPDHRGRSSAGWNDNTPSRPTSKVRASFVPVEPAAGSITMASTTELGESGGSVPELTREESSAGRRRGSFSEGSDNMLPELRKTTSVSEEAERREKASNVAETIPEVAIESAADTPDLAVSAAHEKEVATETPLAKVEASKTKENKGDGREKEIAKPEEKTAGVETKQGAVKTAATGERAPAGEEEVSNRVVEAAQTASTPQVPETMAKSSSSPDCGSAPSQNPAAPVSDKEPKPAQTAKTPPQPIEAPKPSVMAAKSAASSKTAAPALKSPTNSTHSKPETTKTPTKKASRSSLAAPTAASVARMAAGTAASHAVKHSPPSKPKPRDTTKPVDLPSRLTAPTAASRAKHEPESAKPSSSTYSRPKPPLAKPTPRSSLAPGQRPGSSGSTTAGKKAPSHAPDGSFLERMMRPTAASAGKAHDKVETAKSPGRRSTAAPHAKTSVSSVKTNGHVKKPAKSGSSRPGTARSEDANTAGERMSGQQPVAVAADGESGKQHDHATPVDSADGTSHVDLAAVETTPQTNSDARAMEATPAFGDGEIR
ncbi:MAG: hypothetical protein FE78DRAFT_83626 [Acidomyces sp. 'richmondensis']|nr:MAG: hypothetical protein FE78DRAFT_83626 [Acidomyces sp. 'richmondensis']